MDMIHDNQDADELSALRRLYPNLSEQELAEARENLEGYFRIVLRILDRIRSDPEAYARFKRLIEEHKRSNTGEAKHRED